MHLQTPSHAHLLHAGELDLGLLRGLGEALQRLLVLEEVDALGMPETDSL